MIPRLGSCRIAFGCALAVLALGGCRARDNDPGPGGVTVSEARALDDAAQMLEDRTNAPPGIEASADAEPSVKPPEQR